jgi:hypothetical protein
LAQVDKTIGASDQPQLRVLSYGRGTSAGKALLAIRIVMLLLVLVLIGFPTETHRFLNRKEALAWSGMSERQAQGMMFHISTHVTSLGWPSPWLVIIDRHVGKAWQLRQAGVVEGAVLLAGIVCTDIAIRIVRRRFRA